MRFDIITLFPEVITPYLEGSIIGRAVKNKLIKIKVWNLRDFSTDKHNKVDDRAYGGGPGMVMKADIVVKAIKKVLSGNRDKKKTLVVFFEAGGNQFNEKSSLDIANKYSHVILVAGHYEGIDARAIKIIKDLGFKVEEISIGPYVLTGGELPVLILIDAVSRKIKGVLGKNESLEENRLGVGVPSYTRPEIIKIGKKTYKVPDVLLSGHHARIEEWRKKNRK